MSFISLHQRAAPCSPGELASGCKTPTIKGEGDPKMGRKVHLPLPIAKALPFLLPTKVQSRSSIRETDAGDTVRVPRVSRGDDLFASGGTKRQRVRKSPCPLTHCRYQLSSKALEISPQLPNICSPWPAPKSSSKGQKALLSFFTYPLSPVSWSLESLEEAWAVVLEILL